jgi:DnaJ-domain-containing protein 1
MNRNLEKNAFHILNLPHSFFLTKNLLDTAYEAQQKIYHPDLWNQHPPHLIKEIEKISAQINQAYQLLQEPHRRLKELMHKADALNHRVVPPETIFKQWEFMAAFEETHNKEELIINHLTKIYETIDLCTQSKDSALQNLGESLFLLTGLSHLLERAQLSFLYYDQYILSQRSIKKI